MEANEILTKKFTKCLEEARKLYRLTKDEAVKEKARKMIAEYTKKIQNLLQHPNLIVV